jgi:ribosomal protein L7Ae-like RNA K-turn-binding protein
MTHGGRPAPSRGAAGSAEEGLLSLLGLAARAGAVVFGTDMVRRGIREGTVLDVILAADASPTQHDKVIPLMEARGVPYRVLLTRDRLGAATGKGPVTAIGLTNRGFARRAAELADVISSPPAE